MTTVWAQADNFPGEGGGIIRSVDGCRSHLQLPPPPGKEPAPSNESVPRAGGGGAWGGPGRRGWTTAAGAAHGAVRRGGGHPPRAADEVHHLCQVAAIHPAPPPPASMLRTPYLKAEYTGGTQHGPSENATQKNKPIKMQKKKRETSQKKNCNQAKKMLKCELFKVPPCKFAKSLLSGENRGQNVPKYF